MNGCVVCGSTATILRRLTQGPLTYLCRHHEFVCDTHHEDPCPTCDTT